jgi:hypothetical protein
MGREANDATKMEARELNTIQQCTSGYDLLPLVCLSMGSESNTTKSHEGENLTTEANAREEESQHDDKRP